VVIHVACIHGKGTLCDVGDADDGGCDDGVDCDACTYSDVHVVYYVMLNMRVSLLDVVC